MIFIDKKIKVGRATDGLMGGRTRKTRYYAIIDEQNNVVVVSKIMTHNSRNSKHVQRLNNNLRTPIKNFGESSVLDRTLYVEKIDGSLIKSKELDYEFRIFEFNEQQSRKLRRFIFSSQKNRERYKNWYNKNKKKK